MDRSFLSDTSVVAASRSYVCIRLISYDNEAEASFTKALYGQIENTTFGVLTPDAQRKLTAVERGPNLIFKDAAELAAELRRIAKLYSKSTTKPWSDSRPPLMRSVSVALNVAASDRRPLLVLYAQTDNEIEAMSKTIAPVAWSDGLAGQFVFVAAATRTDLSAVAELPKELTTGQLLVVQPGQFGLKGKLHSSLNPSDSKKLASHLTELAASYSVSSTNHRAHVQEGIEAGATWKKNVFEGRSAPPTPEELARLIRGHDVGRDNLLDREELMTFAKGYVSRGQGAGARGRPARAAQVKQTPDSLVDQALTHDLDEDGSLNASELLAFTRKLSETTADAPQRERRGERGRRGGRRRRDE